MILNQQRKVRIARKPLEEFLTKVEKKLGVGEDELAVCFVSDVEIARMNQQFRKKQGPTDVLSFPQENACSPLVTRHSPRLRPKLQSRVKLSSPPSRHSRPAYLGDIAIAPAVARRYAKKNGRTLDSELRILILHGVLHLLGYDHETDRGEMDRVEQKLRRRFGLA